MIGESDLRLIDAYLDDAMTPVQIQEICSRIAGDPDFAAAVDDERADRAIRSRLWQSVQPDEATANMLATRIVSTVRRRHASRAFRHVIRVCAALAACIVLGFVAGWAGRGRTVKISVAPVAPGKVVADARPTTTHVTAAPAPQGAFVALTDEDGKVTAVQYFSRVEDAGQFARDVNGIHTLREQIQQGKIVQGPDDKEKAEF